MIRLVKTCGACPEQYDAYLGDLRVGYLRLRHGSFRVDYPDAGGEKIYQANPKGDGMFEEDERDYYLRCAVDAIERKLVEEAKKVIEGTERVGPDVQYEIVDKLVEEAKKVIEGTERVGSDVQYEIVDNEDIRSD